MPYQRTILLIISGSIAAYKSLDLARRLKEQGFRIRAVLTKGGEEFITPLSVGGITGEQVYTDLFSLKDETEMGHIRLSREADLILVAPGSADLISKLAHGQANDLASATLLAANKPIYIAPAMNHRMWEHPATQRNIAQVVEDGAIVIAPGKGAMACGEYGEGRMAELEDILRAVELHFRKATPLRGLTALVTSGPTFEALDPVRFIGNRSSGKQGHAIAEALAEAGALVTLIAGPTIIPDPEGITTIHVESAEEMLRACREALPVDIAVCAAAVADWKAKKPAEQKMKKDKESKKVPEVELMLNPDILYTISHLKGSRPDLVIGFAAETESVKKNAEKKRKEKGCDWIIANEATSAFGKDSNSVYLITDKGSDYWENLPKKEIGQKITAKIAQYFGKKKGIAA